MIMARTVPCRSTSVAVAMAFLLMSSSALGEPPRADTAAETFEYTVPTRKNYLRDVLEIQALYAFGFLWYLTAARQDWDADYGWETFQQKLTSPPEHDINAFGTNFRGHPFGGTGYYWAARGNRLGIGEAFGITFLSSLGWEYFGEVSERVSANDLIVTPVAGLAIGESFTQLGAYFDRSSRTLWHRTLGTLFGPIKTVNDALDGARLARVTAGVPEREWHEFPLSLSLATVREGGTLPLQTTAGELRLSLSERLSRLAGYVGAAERDEWFSDAELSGIGISAALSRHGLSDLLFEPHVVLLGHYARFARGSGSALRGGGTATGLRVGFSYQLHDYRREQPGVTDRMALVEPVGWFLETRSTLGASRLRLTFDAGAEYGGVHPIALEQYRGSAELPRVLQTFGYYFGAGGRVRSQAEICVGDFRFDANFAALTLGYVDERAAPPLSDGFARFGAGGGFTGISGLSLRAFAERAERFGRMGSVSVNASELTFGIEGTTQL